jgi:hypothetical protein
MQGIWVNPEEPLRFSHGIFLDAGRLFYSAFPAGVRTILPGGAAGKRAGSAIHVMLAR